MGDAEGIARNAVEEIALDGFVRGIGNGMHQAVEAFPADAQFGKQVVDLLVVGDIAGEDQVAAKLFGKLGDAILEAFALVGECQPCTFTMAGLLAMP